MPLSTGTPEEKRADARFFREWAGILQAPCAARIADKLEREAEEAERWM